MLAEGTHTLRVHTAGIIRRGDALRSVTEVYTRIPDNLQQERHALRIGLAYNHTTLFPECDTLWE